MIECKVATLSTFLGPVTVVETARGVRHVDLLDDGARQFAREAAGRFLRLPGEPECAQEFRDYFAGRLRAFTCPMDLVGTDFQRRCWLAVERSVPFGETITYAQEARLADHGLPGRRPGQPPQSAGHPHPLPPGRRLRRPRRLFCRAPGPEARAPAL